MKKSSAEDARSGRQKRIPLIRIEGDASKYVFRFQIGPAIILQLREMLDNMQPMPLADSASAKYPGFYQLIYGGKPKYIGKTDRTIRERIREHSSKLRRSGIKIENVTCRFAFVEDRSLVDVAEGALIDYFGELGLAEWNGSGLGSKVTGYRRGRQRASDFSTGYPVDLQRTITAGSNKPLSMSQLLRTVNEHAPVTISVPREFKAQFSAAHTVTHLIVNQDRTFEQWMDLIQELLSTGWEIERQAESWYVVPVERD